MKTWIPLALLLTLSMFGPSAQAQSYVVTPDATTVDGTLTGTLSTYAAPGQVRKLSGGYVSLIDLRTGTVHRAATDASGAFEIKGVEPSSYGVIARGLDALAVYPIRVAASDQPAELSVIAAPIYQSLMVRTLGAYSGGGEEEPADWEYQEQPDTDTASRGQGNNTVVLDGSGALNGVISYPPGFESGKSIKNMNILLVAENRVLGRAMIEESGSFSIAGVQPGVYGLIAAGESGYTAVGLNIVAADTAKKADKSPFQLASFALQGGGFNLEIVPSSLNQQIQQAINDGDNSPGAGSGPTPPGAGGGTAGGGTGGGGTGGGGGGGGGGSGGGGALAGLAAAGAAAAGLGGGGGGAASGAGP